MTTPGHSMNNEELRIVMVGKNGIGKSAGNTILGRECFESKFSAKSMTVDCSKARGTVDGQKVAVIDTPDLFDRFTEEEAIAQCISYAAPGPHVFLVVIRLGRFTQEEMETAQWIKEIFDQAAEKYSMVLFTHGDQLKGTTIEEFLDESPDLQKLVGQCNGQYHIFNNKNKDQSQVTELLQKIRDIVEKNGGNHYTNQMIQKAETLTEEKKQCILKEKEEELLKEREELEKNLREKYEMEMNRIKEQLQAERERERKEREERKGERKNEERKEREEREAERAREMGELQKQYESDLKKQLENLQKEQEDRARQEAEESNPLYQRHRASTFYESMFL